jgi:heterotetrameric sarcosine oxidase gamma subunit
VAEFTPIARGPIALRSAVVRDGWEVSDVHSDAALRIADCTPLAKWIVRAEPMGAAAGTLDTPHGSTRREGDVLVVGSAPGEWTLLGPTGPTGRTRGTGGTDAAALAKRACESGAGEFSNCIDQTHGRALLRITGERARDLLAKVCGIDLDDRVTPNGTAFRSSVAKLVTDVAREDVDGVPSYWLHCERSSGQYLFDALLDAGEEFGVELDRG